MTNAKCNRPLAKVTLASDPRR